MAKTEKTTVGVGGKKSWKGMVVTLTITSDGYRGRANCGDCGQPFASQILASQEKVEAYMSDTVTKHRVERHPDK